MDAAVGEVLVNRVLTKEGAADYIQSQAIDPAVLPLGIITLEDVLEGESPKLCTQNEAHLIIFNRAHWSRDLRRV